MKSSVSFLTSLLLLFVFAMPTLADTEIEGDITGELTLEDSPYLVTGDIRLPWERELSIEAGVELRFSEGTGFDIEGTLTAIGTAEAPILFTSASDEPSRGDWRGVRFEDSQIIEHIIAEYAETAFSGYTEGHFESRFITIRHCERALMMENGSNQPIILRNSLFTDNALVFRPDEGWLFLMAVNCVVWNNDIVGDNLYDFGEGPSLMLNSSIVWNNGELFGGEVEEDAVSIVYSSIEGGYEGEGNIDDDPLFVDPDNGDFHLHEDSPCIDAGDLMQRFDLDGSRNDIGLYGGFGEWPVTPLIMVEPEGLNFRIVQVGQVAMRSVTVTNDGHGDLVIEEITVEAPFSAGTDDEGNLDLPMTLRDSESAEIFFFFEPEEGGGFTVDASFVSNDFYEREPTVRLTGEGIGFEGTLIAGALQGVLTLENSPYLVIEDIWLDWGNNLTIEAGVEIHFAGSGFYVEGRLTAMGTEEAPILFTSASDEPSRSDWRGIRFEDSQNFEHIIVEYATNAFSGYTEVQFEARFITIRHCESAIMIENSSNQPIILRNSLFTDNALVFRPDEGWLFLMAVNCVVWNNDIVGDNLYDFGEGPSLMLNSSIVWNNGELFGEEVEEGAGSIVYSCIEGGYEGEGNIDDDPGLVDPDNGDFHLQEDSPCIDAGDPMQRFDVDENRNDIGLYGGFGEWPVTPLISIEPLALDFRYVQVGRVGVRSAFITNVGHGDLIVEEIAVDAPFSVGTDREGNLELPLTLGDSESAELFFFFEPEEGGEFTVDASLVSNDFYEREPTVRLTGEGIAFDGTLISGDLEGELSLDDSPYLVLEDIRIPWGRSLTIEAGVALRFKGSGFEVQGQLTAVGTAEAPILFTSVSDEPSRGDWRGIWFYEGHNLEYITAEYAETAFSGYTEDQFESRFITIRHCETAAEMGTENIQPVVFRNSFFTDNGVVFRGGESFLMAVNCVVWNNDMVGYELHDWREQYSLLLNSSIIWNNEDLFDEEVEDNVVSITYSCIEGGYEGQGNIHDDPLFVDPDNGDFHLQEDSPCIDAGDPELPRDPDDTRADMGMFYFNQGGLSNLVVSFEEGWNMISLNIIPGEELWTGDQGPDVELMMEQIRIDEDRHRLIIMKDEDGRFYLPDWDHNDIPFWDIAESYMVKVSQDVEATWEGETIAADTDVQIDEGWNYIPYYPTYELPADAPDFYVLSSIIDLVWLAKNAEGFFMVPEWEYSNMPPWRETQGYQVKVSEDVVLNYPAEQQELASASLPPALRGGIKGGAKNTHWQTPSLTGQNMSVLITNIQNSKFKTQNCQIAAFNIDGKIVGVGQVNYEGRCGLAVWGDDPTTDLIDGLQEGEAFELRYWDANEDKEIELELKAFHAGKGLIYETNSFLVVDASRRADIPQDYYLSQNYPNPFNNATRFKYGLPEAGHVSLKVYDISGRLVATLVEGDIPAGKHAVTWEAASIATGVYLVQMETSGFCAVRKVMLVR